MKRLIAVVCVALFATVSARADEPKVTDAKPLKAPFDTLKTQHMAVQVKINGKGPYRLIFDTGAPVTLLNNKTARETGLIDKNAKGIGMLLLPGVELPKAKTLQIGDVTAKDVPVVVMDHPTVKLVSKYLGPIEGIVGFSFFARYRMTIDYQTKEMTFVPVSYDPPNVMAKMMNVFGGPKAKQKILAPAGQWGFSVTKEKGDEEAGVTVKAVLPDSPAAKAGLQVGDRLLTLDGRWTDSVADTYQAASHVRPGTTAQLVVRREGKEKELTVNVRSGL
ncbi:MAG: PDZ domain-containing protein [Gemmataceae bacterium]|nr:PDZ domain-containing protein [Gemmataceae bacterium]